MWSIPRQSEATFQGFEEARAAAQRVAALGHLMQWMTWGSPPRCTKAGCVRCGRDLVIVRTRRGQFRLEGTALQGCAPPKVVPLEAESPLRKIA
jgi:hypothetical protein